MNHRKFYTETLKVDLPRNVDIHHIDGNKSNNSISNLVAIPKSLHLRYHLQKNKILSYGYSLEVITTVSEDIYSDLNFIIKEFLRLRPLYYEIERWIILRERRLAELILESNSSNILFEEYSVFNLSSKKHNNERRKKR